ncbi:glycosyltransferase family 4 protein [Calothrix sp. NIES-2098]|uniref:glycosyltransferase family 4 protein n=1 Tax=Calothrix sp. NIES-2098 TaxID=1954171 RepID=UPI000B601396|nr:putative glycosyl transferase [Calothrix sp. NIES-2098]
MHILKVHNYYQIRGGEEETIEAEARLLQQMGHQVEIYQDTNDRLATLGAARMAIKTVWSGEAYTTLKHRFGDQTYDVMHVDNFFPLISPSIYYAAKEAGVPVVQTLHNYRLLCPNALFFREGRICEDCLGKPIPFPGVQHGCYRQSKATSAAVATMLTVHRLLNTWTKMVDCYIALTEFARQKFIQGGLPAEKIVVKPHFISPDPGVGSGEGGYALYVGRLSVEKGLDTLLAAWEQLGGKIPLKIIGDGQLCDRVAEAVNKLPHVEWLGRKPMQEVYELMGEAKVLIFPSKWYETFGRVAIEAFAKGTPVIAANIGAIAELVDPGRTGLHFRPGDSQDLAQKVEWVLSHPAELAQMRREARAEFEVKYTAEKNYQQLMEIYTQVQPHPKTVSFPGELIHRGQ